MKWKRKTSQAKSFENRVLSELTRRLKINEVHLNTKDDGFHYERCAIKEVKAGSHWNLGIHTYIHTTESCKVTLRPAIKLAEGMRRPTVVCVIIDVVYRVARDIPKYTLDNGSCSPNKLPNDKLLVKTPATTK